MLNRITVQGRFVADPEFRTTTTGTSVATFRLACDRNFADKQTGQREADFFTCVAWRGTAEFVSRYFSRGNMAVVEGRLQSRNYTDKDGNKRTAVEIVADNVYFCESKKDSNSNGTGSGFNGGGGQAQFVELDDDGEIPF